MITVISKKFPRKGADSPNAPSSVATFNAISPNPNSVYIGGINKGSADAVIVFMKKGQGHKPIPIDKVAYSANSIYSFGSLLDGFYCVGKGDIGALTITGLTYSTQYHIIIYTYNIAYGEPYYNTQLITNSNSKIVTTRR